MREMKDSGIEWIGEIPKLWQCCKQKYMIQLINGRAYSDNEFEEDGKYRILRVGNLFSNPIWYTSSLELPDNKYCVEGDLLYSWSMSYSPVIWQGERAIYHYHIWKVVLNEDLDKLFAYYYYTTLTDALKAEIHETTMGFITMGIMNNSYIPFPPLVEQRSIVTYLDTKCSEIDSLISDIQKQIDTLEQYKRSVITKTVTKGLNPDVEMKDSGVAWIGKISKHWDCQRGKYILHYIQKPMKDDDCVITCFRDGEVTLRSNRREDGFTIADKEIGYQGIDIGDLVVHGMDGFAGAIGISDSRGKASPVLNVLDTEQNKRYIMYYLRSMAYNDVFIALATGIRVRSCDLRWNKLAELIYPLPPTQEQEAIVQYIDSVLECVNAVITNKKQQIATIEEYKKSLIFEYVTGKKEVPSQTVIIDPKVILAGTILNKLGTNLKGKIQVQKIMYLCETMLGLPFQTQYFRYQHGPYDKNIDTYLAELNSNQWFVIQDNSPMNCCKGDKFSDFENEHLTAFSEYNAEIEKIVSFIAPMKTSQAERIATLFAVWNDFIIDGVINPPDEQIINEVVTKWTPNKANSEKKTWQGTLDKMKKNGIIPKGFGKHTQPKDI